MTEQREKYRTGERVPEPPAFHRELARDVRHAFFNEYPDCGSGPQDVLLNSLVLDAIDRAVRAEYNHHDMYHRKAIAAIQALLLAIRHPGVYRMDELTTQTEAFWRELNDWNLRKAEELRVDAQATTEGVT